MFVEVIACVLTEASSLPLKPDPCKEPCNILVKIADLGNACWTVSYFGLVSISWVAYLSVEFACDCKECFKFVRGKSGRTLFSHGLRTVG